MQSESTENVPAPLPVWLSIPIILVCLSGGGWIIHWYVMTDPVSHESKILGDAPTPAQWQGGGNRRGNVQRRMVQFDKNNGNLEIRTEKARAMLTVTDGKASLRNIFYLNTSFVPPDARKTIMAARSLSQDQKRTEALKLDIHQVNRLRNLSGTPPMVLSADDKAALLTAAENYVADEPGRVAMEPKLLQQLDEIGDRSTDATKSEAIERAAQIEKMITPDMWTQDGAMGGAGK